MAGLHILADISPRQLHCKEECKNQPEILDKPVRNTSFGKKTGLQKH